MMNFEEREYIRPFPRPFIMDAMQLIKTHELSDAKKIEITGLFFEYYKNCAREEIAFFDGMMTVLRNTEK